MIFRGIASALILALTVLSSEAALERIARSPYVGAVVIDAGSGAVLFEDNADARGYPASVTKLMTFAVVMDRIAAGQLTLQSPVTVSAAAANTGGSQVYLKQGEVFSVEDLLVALIVSSANDAAIALASHVAGTREAFVGQMNAKARELGMTATEFHSPHGLPPSAGQKPDVSTARDLATLSRYLVQRGDVLPFSSIKVRMLRANSANPFEMRNHNNLLGKLAGCDGLKTGYFNAAGSSLAATAERGGRRLVTVVLGSDGSKARDLKAMELLEQGFATPAGTAAAPAVKPARSDMPTVRTAETPAPSTPKAPTLIFRVDPVPPKKP